MTETDKHRDAEVPRTTLAEWIAALDRCLAMVRAINDAKNAEAERQAQHLDTLLRRLR